MAKELKTAAELKQLLSVQLGKSTLQLDQGLEPKFIRIIPVNPPQDGANWALIFSPDKNRTDQSNLSAELTRIGNQLQTKYDLKPD